MVYDILNGLFFSRPFLVFVLSEFPDYPSVLILYHFKTFLAKVNCCQYYKKKHTYHKEKQQI